MGLYKENLVYDTSVTSADVDNCADYVRICPLRKCTLKDLEGKRMISTLTLKWFRKNPLYVYGQRGRENDNENIAMLRIGKSGSSGCGSFTLFPILANFL